MLIEIQNVLWAKDKILSQKQRSEPKLSSNPKSGSQFKNIQSQSLHSMPNSVLRSYFKINI